MAKSTQPIQGLKELKAAMKALPLKLQRNVITAAVRGGAAEVAKQAKKNLPPNYVTLRKSIKARKRRPKNRYEIRFTVHPERGPRAKFDGWYAHIVEDGAQPHEIERSRFKRSLSLAPDFSRAYVKVHHPGVRPTKFMTRAARREQAILQAITKAGQRSFKRLKLKGGY